MAESPSVHKDRVLACSVYCNGSKLKDEYALVSAMVHQELNRIGKATLKFNAGNMDKQTFDESDADLFKPGNTIRLDAGDIVLGLAVELLNLFFAQVRGAVHDFTGEHLGGKRQVAGNQDF